MTDDSSGQDDTTMVGGGWRSDDERGDISHSYSATAILKYQTPFV
jgi:hypothetical protein